MCGIALLHILANAPFGFVISGAGKNEYDVNKHWPVAESISIRSWKSIAKSGFAFTV